MLKMKRVYDAPDKEDGFRILVDRLWPRGMQKERAAIDDWAKNIAPTTEIRKEFAHQADRFDDFKRLYIAELEQNPDVPPFLELLREKLGAGNVTFVYAAKDTRINHVVVLKEFAENQLKI